MELFVSWSKDRSRMVAIALCEWIEVVMQSVKPWMSTQGEKGDRWNKEISARLARSKLGILCLTAENLDEAWLLFEAGAIAKTGDARAMTFLLDVEPSEVKYPLAQFMHTSSRSRDDVLEMLKTINKRLGASRKGKGPALDPAVLEKAFNLTWPELDEKLREIREMQVGQPDRKRSMEDMLAELIDLSRKIDQRVVSRSIYDMVNAGDVVETPYGNFKAPALRQLADSFVSHAKTEISVRDGAAVVPTSEVRRMQMNMFANIPKEVQYLFKNPAIMELHKAIKRKGLRIQSLRDIKGHTSTLLDLPPASSRSGELFVVTDCDNRLVQSDGVNWIWVDTKGIVTR